MFSTLSYILAEVGKIWTKGPIGFFNFADPLVVILVLFLLLLPFAMAYMVVAKLGFIKLTQIEVKDKNILYVVSRPGDEAL